MIADWLGYILLALSALGCGYLLVSALAVRRFARRPRAPSVATPVTVLKPLQGAEAGLVRRLSSFLRQDYDAPIEIVFGVSDPGDPALAAVRELKAQFPKADIKTVISSRSMGENPKASNLANMADAISHPTVVIADSDIEVAPDHLGRVVGALAEPGVGAVTCLYYGEPTRGAWSRLGALAIDSHFLPSVTVALLGGLAHPTFGSTLALPREVLHEIGGFMPVADQLADDYALGEAVRKTGRRIEIPALVVSHAMGHQTLAELWRQELRWARTNRSIEPLGYSGSIVTHPMPLGLLGWVAGSFPSLLMAAAALILRLYLCVIVERSLKVPRHAYLLLPVREVLSFAVFAWSFAGDRIDWRGRRYWLLRDGSLTTSREEARLRRRVVVGSPPAR